MIKRSDTKLGSLDLESLVPRAMFGGDVTVAVLDGDVVVHGDAAANKIVVATDAETGALVVDGRIHAGEATTINGQQGPFIFDDFNNSLRIHMLSGADIVEIPQADFADNLFIGMGRGADRLSLGWGGEEATAAPGVNVDGRLTIGLGRGSDVLATAKLTSDSMAVFAGLGDDQIGLGDTAVENHLLVRTGPGADRVGFSNVRSAVVDVRMGTGHDRLTVLDSVFARLDARMGAGNDRVQIGATNISALATLGGGEGHDVIVNLGGNHANHYVVAGFEVIWNGDHEGAFADDGSETTVSTEINANHVGDIFRDAPA
jgi:hypothetical protein